MTTAKCDYCGADTPQDKITKRDCFNFCGFCVEELKDAKETRWNAETSPERIQGTICEDGTGAEAAERKAARLREIKDREAAKTFERILNTKGPRRWEVVTIP